MDDLYVPEMQTEQTRFWILALAFVHISSVNKENMSSIGGTEVLGCCEVIMFTFIWSCRLLRALI